MDNHIFKALVQSAYDLQDTRLRVGARLVANFKAKLGQEPSQTEETIDDAEAKKLLDELRDDYKRLTDGVASNRIRADKFDGERLITHKTELLFIENYFTLEHNEAKQFREIGNALKEFRIWNEFMLGVKGCGPAMGGIIIATLDPHKAYTISGFWKYCGLDVCADGRGRSRRKEHLVEQEYVDKDGVVQTKMGLGYNPLVKTKLVGVMGGCLIKAGDPRYRKFYDDYKHRIATNPNHAEKSKGHIHAMAMRYMVKMFLADLWLKWREIEGLETRVSYHEQYQNHVHKAA
jgi:hypothetical protein